MITKIKSINDVEAFFRHLLENESLNFHPDERFENYINLETRLPSYTYQEADLREYLLKQCFEICEARGEDIYIIGLSVFHKKLIQ